MRTREKFMMGAILYPFPVIGCISSMLFFRIGQLVVAIYHVIIAPLDGFLIGIEITRPIYDTQVEAFTAHDPK